MISKVLQSLINHLLPPNLILLNLTKPYLGSLLLIISDYLRFGSIWYRLLPCETHCYVRYTPPYFIKKLGWHFEKDGDLQLYQRDISLILSYRIRNFIGKSRYHCTHRTRILQGKPAIRNFSSATRNKRLYERWFRTQEDFFYSSYPIIERIKWLV